jgi:hypothetical protein
MTHFVTTHSRERHSFRVPDHLVIRATEPTCEEVSRLAYSYWESRGRADGWDVQDWLLAERVLRQQKSAY